jgi:muramoyltetrapeptide carboxypeptidase LdcA involved in peptidoglycan recycling
MKTLHGLSDLTALLHSKVPRRGLSKYVADAFRKALEEEEQKQMFQLEATYEAANKDRNRLKTIEEWKTIENVDNTEG